MNPASLDNPIIIIGSGLAAYTVIREFRKLQPDFPIIMVTKETGDFYSKPMLSTAFTNNKEAGQLITSPKEKMMEQLKFELHHHAEVTSVNVSENFLIIQNAENQQVRLPYSKLVLAVGADPIRLEMQGDGVQDILSVNDLNDYAIFREQLKGKNQVSILGAGLIGCEFANDLINGGLDVSVIDIAPLPLGRLLPPQVAEVIKVELEKHGVYWFLNNSASSIRKVDDRYLIELNNGEQLSADIVLSAVGLRPRIQLAQQMGLDVNKGIIVNRQLRTSQTNVFAIGDCAEIEGLVLPYVLPIMNAGKVLAAQLADQESSLSYPAMPVMVKTPAIPLIISPPAIGSEGQWQFEEMDNGLIARFYNTQSALVGFALVGSATSQRAALTKELPPVLS